MNYKKISKCRICKSDKIKKILDLGVQAFTGKFSTSYKKNISKSPLSICPRSPWLASPGLRKKEELLFILVLYLQHVEFL